MSARATGSPHRGGGVERLGAATLDLLAQWLGRCHDVSIRPVLDPATIPPPPGQTSLANLACLCRRHHRLKTLTAWTYERAGPAVPSATYRWTSAHGTVFRT